MRYKFIAAMFFIWSLIFSFFTFAAEEETSKNYVKVGGVYGEYKSGDYVLPNKLRGFGLNYGYGRYLLSPLAIELNVKTLFVSTKNEDYTYYTYMAGPRLTISNVSIFGGIALANMREYDDFIMYYLGMGGDLKAFDTLGIFAELTYNFSKIKAIEFTSGVKVYF